MTMTWLLDIYHVDPADTSDVQILRFSTGRYSDGTNQWTPAILRWPRVEIALADGLLSSGPSSPNPVTVPIGRDVFGADRLSALDGRSYIGRRAYCRGVGTGGDGTAYTESAPLVVADGSIEGIAWDTHVADLKIRPHSKAHRVTLPTKKLIGYPNGLRGNGLSSGAEIVGYNTVPTAFTLIALVLTPRVWPGAGADKMTLFDQASVKAYYELSGTHERSVVLDVRNAANTAWHTLTGTAWEPDEGVHWLSYRFDTSTRATRLGLDAAFEDITPPADFGALAGNWSALGDEFDTIAGAFVIFPEWLTDAKLASYFQRRLTGDEGMDVYFPGESAAGFLLDYAAANRDNPLDATITDATAAPLFSGQADQAGADLPYIPGFVRNAPVIMIDSVRNIGRIAGDPLGSIDEAFDRSVDQDIETVYDSPLDLWDGGSPTAAGQLSATGHFGGIVRYHTIPDGAELSANVGGHCIWGYGLSLGSRYGNADVNFGTQLGPTYQTGQWGHEVFFRVQSGMRGSYLWFSDHWQLNAYEAPDGKSARFRTAVATTSGSLLSNIELPIGASVAYKVEAFNDGLGGSAMRVLINGKVVDSDAKPSNTLSSSAASLDQHLVLFEGTSPSPPFDPFQLDDVVVLPMRLWSTVGATDAAAEATQRLYMFDNPDPSTIGLEGLWYRYKDDPLVLVDETANGFDGTVSATAVWGPGIGMCASRLFACKKMLAEAGTEVTFEESAYDADSSAIGLYFASATSVAAATADMLRGGGLYLLLLQDSIAYVGQVQDPATGTPVATYRVRSAAEYEETPPPSQILALWGDNPREQATALPGANAAQEAFSGSQRREIPIEAGDNRSIYDDDPAPQGRRITLDTHFSSAGPAQSEGERWADMWEPIRPLRGGKAPLLILDGYNAVRPGQLVTLKSPDLPGGEVDVLVLRTVLDEAADEIVVR